MAADYFIVTRTNRPQLGSQLIRAANLLQEVRELVANLNGIGQHQFDGGDYTMMEAQFGLPAGQGDDVLSLLDSMNTVLNTATDVTGANRSSFTNQFVTRLAGQ